MKQTITSLLVLLIATMAYSQTFQSSLAWGFEHPQDTARTKVWWFHGETPSTHEGITADLESFKEKGVGGVVFYDQVHGKGEGAAKVFSPEWWDELLFSSQEAKRLDLSFEINCSNGYVAGGKWITPDKSMQSLACTECIIDGGGDRTFQMPLPDKVPGGWYHDEAIIALPYNDLLWETREMPHGKNFTARSITYEVTAKGKARTSSMQVPLSYFKKHPDLPQVDSTSFFGCGFVKLKDVAELQASDDGVTYHKVCDLRPRYRNMGGIKRETVSFPTITAPYFRIVPKDSTVTISNIVLSARAQVDAWQEKASLISDFIDGDHTPHYEKTDLVDFSQTVDLTQQLQDGGVVTWKKAPKGKWLVLRFLSVSNGGHTKHGRKEALGLECDKLSVEGSRLQWKSYVKPVIDSIRAHGGKVEGVCMDSHEAGPQNWTMGFPDEFKRLRGYDIRKYLPVMAGFIVSSKEESDHFLHDLRRTISDLITDRYYGEMNRLCQSEGLTLTAQAIGGALCMAGDAIEVKKSVEKPQAEFWGYQTEGNYDIKDCSSSAHLYGKQIASGEAFTDVSYKHTLADIKSLADYAYCFGINELVVCAVAYQPWIDNRLNTANGRQYVLNRKNTFWPMTRPFWDYQARCSWMMRQGKPVADVCVYLGDEVPIRILTHKLPHLPKGYDFDAFTTDALLHRMKAQNGRIVLPDGISYKVMILPSDGELPLEAKLKIKYFRKQGVLVYDPQEQKQTLEEVLCQAGLSPDVDAPSAQQLYFAHRRTKNEDIYFLNNHCDQFINDNFAFHATASSAELWNPLTGERFPLSISHQDGHTKIPLSMAPHESYFIVLTDREEEKNEDNQTTLAQKQHFATQTVPIKMSSWKVSFDTKLGGPSKPVVFPCLSDWTQDSLPQIKYFSGTAICRSSFSVGKLNRQHTYRLKIPLLNTAAEVIVNGHSVGIVWCSPWSIDITQQIHKGKNQLELRMANSLWNRLVGDANLPESERIILQNYPLAKPTDTLVPSGLREGISLIEEGSVQAEHDTAKAALNK